jgi:hypothetical protein
MYGVGHKPNISHFFIFGDPTFAHIPNEKQIKLDFKSIKGIIVGYDEFVGIKGYKIYDLIIFGNYSLITILFLNENEIISFWV